MLKWDPKTKWGGVGGWVPAKSLSGSLRPRSPLARPGDDKVSGALDIVSWFARKKSKALEEAGPGSGF